ncbi:MAG: DUF3108 domain-containing protein [Candidatus Omnitrophica bacterium]|nr:DUF3108 domain-containing protein [Candidatus Omnitrophota bacterium]
MNLALRFIRIFFLFFSFLAPVALADEASSPLPFSPGETIRYDIKKLNIKWGEATMTFHGIASLDGRPELLITVTSSGFKFFDEEKIYFDPKAFLPVRVERDLDIFGKKEKITEYYNAEQKTVRIVKTAKGKTTEQTIRRPGPLDNMYCFIFRYRMAGKFQKGEDILIHLPTRDVRFQLMDIQPLAIDGKAFTAHYMQSDPAKYSVWFAADSRRVPLRIDGTAGIGKTAMIMVNYQK